MLLGMIFEGNIQTTAQGGQGLAGCASSTREYLLIAVKNWRLIEPDSVPHFL